MGSPSESRFRFGDAVRLVVLIGLGVLLIFGGVKSIESGMPERVDEPSCIGGPVKPGDSCVLTEYEEDFFGNEQRTTETLTYDEVKDYQSQGPQVGPILFGAVMILAGGVLVFGPPWWTIRARLS